MNFYYTYVGHPISNINQRENNNNKKVYLMLEYILQLTKF